MTPPSSRRRGGLLSVFTREAPQCPIIPNSNALSGESARQKEGGCAAILDIGIVGPKMSDPPAVFGEGAPIEVHVSVGEAVGIVGPPPPPPQSPRRKRSSRFWDWATKGIILLTLAEKLAEYGPKIAGFLGRLFRRGRRLDGGSSARTEAPDQVTACPAGTGGGGAAWSWRPSAPVHSLRLRHNSQHAAVG